MTLIRPFHANLAAAVLVVVVYSFAVHFVDAEYRAYDGTANNRENPQWGAAKTDFLRQDPYIRPPFTQPTSHLVSRMLFQGMGGVTPSNTHNLLFVAIGQFLLNDLMRPKLLGRLHSLDLYTIIVRDSNQDLSSTNFTNLQSAYIDLSNLYGVDDETTESMRLFKGGLLAMQNGSTLASTCGHRYLVYFSTYWTTREELFACGDARCNNNVMQMALTTLFALEHNRKATELAAIHADWDDEKLFQEARQWTIAVWQNIVYTEYLPHILPSPLPPYAGYNKTVDAGVDIFFFGAASRVGHGSMPAFGALVHPDDARFRSNYTFVQRDSLRSILRAHGITAALYGSMGVAASRPDGLHAPQTYARRTDAGADMTGRFPAFDLAAADVYRGRSVGLHPYSYYRAKFGLLSKPELGDASAARMRALVDLYGPELFSLDAYVGGAMERVPTGKAAGPLFAAAFAEQFRRLRDGDRFYYELMDDRIDLAAVRAHTLRHVIEANTPLRNVPDQPMASIVESIAAKIRVGPRC